MKMDYDTYEYSVIKKIYDMFKIESIEFNCKETIFNFDNNFKFAIGGEIIKEMFECDYGITIVTEEIKRAIEGTWVKEIKK